MKKRLTIIAILMMFCSTMFAQDNHWNLETNYQNSMTLICSVQINGTTVTEGVEIAAFCGGVLRSNGVSIESNGLAYVQIWGNKNDKITFKLFDGEKELVTDYTLTFKVNGSVGFPDGVSINFVRELHWEYTGNPQVTMAVMAIIKIDGNSITNEGYQLAAFSGDELRGVCMPKKNNINGNEVILSSLSVAGLLDENDEEIEETISFKLWDYANEKEYVALNTLPFEGNAEIGNPEPYEINFLSFDPVAKIGDVNYQTLAAALTDVTAESNTITVLKDIEEAGLVIDKDVTIDFNTHVYTLESGITINKVFTEGEANEVTFKNGTFNVAESAEVSYLVKNYADLTIENMTFNGSENNSYVLSFVSGEVSIKNSSINAYDAEHYAFQTCDEETFSAPVVTLWHESADSDGNVISYSNEVIGLVEYTAGSIIGNTDAILDVVAKKQFNGVGYDNQGSVEGWGTISTPVYTDNNFIPIPDYSTVEHDLYKYNEPSYNWLFYKGDANPFSTFDLGQGYLYANNNDYTFELKGKLANGRTVSFGISYSPETANSYAGFNFIGNPYLHQISFGNFEAEAYTLAEGFYVVSEDGTLQSSLPNQTISPMESVMLQLIPKATRSGNIKTMLNIYPTAVEKRSSTNNGYLAINVSNENYSDVAYVALGENEGLNKIGHYNTEAPMVYVPVDGADYAIATMNQDVTMVPVSFNAATMGEYTIAVEAQNCEYSTMTLVDRFTGVETNLLLEDYSFIAKSNDSADRFFIRLENSQQTTDNSNFAYIDNGMINIDVEGQAMINVYDVTGRSVAEYNVFESASISTSDFANGMYIIRMSDESGVKVQKVVIE